MQYSNEGRKWSHADKVMPHPGDLWEKGFPERSPATALKRSCLLKNLVLQHTDLIWTLATSLAGKNSKATPQTIPCQWGRSGWGLWNRDRWPGFHILTSTVNKASLWEIEVARQMILLMGKGEFPVGDGCWECNRPDRIEKNILLRLTISSLCSVRTDEKGK